MSVRVLLFFASLSSDNSWHSHELVSYIAYVVYHILAAVVACVPSNTLSMISFILYIEPLIILCIVALTYFSSSDYYTLLSCLFSSCAYWEHFSVHFWLFACSWWYSRKLFLCTISTNILSCCGKCFLQLLCAIILSISGTHSVNCYSGFGYYFSSCSFYSTLHLQLWDCG